MEAPGQVRTSPPPGFSAALEQLWSRFLPDIEERVAVLESSASAVAAGSLTPEQQQAAQAAAHKLAGVLGSFGINEGTAPAREAEKLYSLPGAPSPESAGQLAGLAAALRSLVEARKQPPPATK